MRQHDNQGNAGVCGLVIIVCVLIGGNWFGDFGQFVGLVVGMIFAANIYEN
ncbi:MAG: hypothetical protein HOH43_27320 [Candidatus Latescibacteria bacterium]|jgi:hypothetical protein|nr:hypothetical protein [Candidatus Latescibacterota bacterium]